MNTKYGKINLTGGIEYAPSTLHTDHGLSFNPSEADYIAAGWLKIVNNQPETREGFYPVRGKYVEVEGHIETMWIYQSIPVTPKTYNKYRLGMAIQSAGLLDALLGFFSANPAAKFHWDNAQDFSDNDENFKAIVAVFVEQFGEDKVTEILTNAEV